MKITNIQLIILLFLVFSMLPVIPSFNNDTIRVPKISQIRVLDYNLHFGQSVEGKYNVQELRDLILKEKPNIVGFQEITFYAAYNGFAPMYIELVNMMKEIGFKYSYTNTNYNYILSNIIFSQFKIIDKREVVYNSQKNLYQRNFIDLKLDINGIVTHAIVTHLTHKPGGGRSGEIRVKQMSQLLDYVKSLKLNNENIIVMGDFNVVPIREGIPILEYTMINSTLIDAWTAINPTQDGFTSPVDNPSKRIDFIFINSQITPIACHTVSTTVSDHLPVICDLQLS